MSLAVLCVITFVTIFLLALLGILGPLAQVRRQSRLARVDELNRYRLVGAYAEEQDDDSAEASGVRRAQESALAKRALAAIDHAVRARGRRDQLIDELERSGMRMRPEEWAAVQIVAVIMLAGALGFLVGSLLAVPPGGLLGWIGCRVFIRFKIKKRAAAFEAALPDALQLIAGALRSGFALNQSIGAVVREGIEPIAGEFGRALQEVRLGAELVDALDATAERMNSYDLELVVMCIRTSREVGGNLSEALDTTVHTMRERVQLKGQVRVLSAEGRLAAKVLTGLPILLASYFYFVRRDYLRVLYTTGPGVVILAVGVVLLCMGSFWLSRLTKIEV
jgi:tight adherence protein B